jgi:hypothetical protein
MRSGRTVFNYRYIDELGRGIPTSIKIMGKRARFEELSGQFQVALMVE